MIRPFLLTQANYFPVNKKKYSCEVYHFLIFTRKFWKLTERHTFIIGVRVGSLFWLFCVTFNSSPEPGILDKVRIKKQTGMEK